MDKKNATITKMLSASEGKLLHHLSQYISDHKKECIEKVLAERTRYITVVLEDIFQSQNSSAVIRTCECMGLQDVHIIEQESSYSLNRKVLRGSYKWMSLIRYRDKTLNNTQVCYETLRENGYRILCADPDQNARSLEDMEVIDQPLAIVFGNELNGLSDYALRHADERVYIPIRGFTESFNISVSVAIFLCNLMGKLRQANESYHLSEDEKNFLRLMWYRKIVRRSEIVEREFLRTIA